jgi:alpha-mannosidase
MVRRTLLASASAFAVSLGLAALLTIPSAAHNLPRREGAVARARPARPVSTRTATPAAPQATAAPRVIYIANDDHSDYLWSGNDVTYRSVFTNTLDYYMNQIEATADNQPGLRGRFNCDGSIWVWEYERNRTLAQVDRLIGHIRAGDITVPLNPVVQLYGAMPAEAVIRGFLYAGQLERRFGMRFPLVIPMENQTLPGGVGSLWAGCGARYAWKGICDCATRIDATDRPREIYRFGGPDGQSVVLKWNSTLGFGNQSIGGYAEARDSWNAIDIMSYNSEFLARWPYSVAGAFGYGWDDLEGTTDELIQVAEDATNASRTVVVSNEIDFFEDFIARHGSELESFGGSFGNEWDLLTASMGEVTAGARRGIEKLRTSEALACVALLNDSSFMDGRTTRRDSAMFSCGLYYEHSWTDGPGVSNAERAAWQRRIEQAITGYADQLQADALTKVGSQISTATWGERHFVFNPLSWKRTDFVDLTVSTAAPRHVVDVVTGAEVPSQTVTVAGQQRLRILASDVPSVGYKVFEIRSGAGQPFSNATTVGLPSFENSYYRITVGTRGQITSLVDFKDGGRQLVPTGAAIHDLGDGNGAVTLENHGPVSTTLLVNAGGSPAHSTRVTLYASPLDRIDVEGRISQNFGGTEAWESRFDLAGGVWRHEEVGMIARVARQSNGGDYADQNARTDWLTLNHFADFSQDTRGVTVSSWDSPFFSLGSSTPTTLDATSNRFRAVVGMQVDGSELGIDGQGGTSSFLNRYAFRTHGAFNAAAAMRFSLEHQNPLVAGRCTGNQWAPLPAGQFSLVSVDQQDVLLWAFKPAMDGTAMDVIARVWNLADFAQPMTMRLPGRSISTARRVTHIETDLGPVPFTPTGVFDDLTRQQMKSWRLRFTTRPTGIGPVEPGQSLAFSVFPNPGAGETDRVIQFVLPVDGRVRAELFDIGGRRVRTLIDGQMTAGRQDTRWSTAGLAAGVYVVRLEAMGQTEERRIAIIQ